MLTVRIINADVLDGLAHLADESVHCCVTSPPYWGLRDYGIPPSVWGGDPACEHAWGDAVPGSNRGGSGTPTDKNGRGENYGRDAGRGCWCDCGAWRGCLGLEPTPALYVEHIVAVFREVRRVLRDDGTLWLNLGDSYATGAGKASSPGGGAQGERFKDIGPTGYRGAHDLSPKHAHPQVPDAKNPDAMIPTYQPNRMPQEGLKPKDLSMIPARVALALQEDGWYLRSMIPWLKRNAMPESVTDRPATATEYVFLLSKREKYFYDGEAVKIKSSEGTHARRSYKTPDGWDKSSGEGGHGSIHKQGREKGHVNPDNWNGSSFDRGKTGEAKHTRGCKVEDARENGKPAVSLGAKSTATGSGNKSNDSMNAALQDVVPARNRRNSDAFFESWQGLLTDDDGELLAFVVNSQPFKAAHFATFPPRLVEPMILAGTSAHGCCAGCGAPWKRDVDVKYENPGNRSSNGPRSAERKHMQFGAAGYDQRLERRSTTTGWQPTCKCGITEAVPATVLDPFGGAGTTGLVADRLQRNAVLIEIKSEYADMARARIDVEAPLFAQVP